VKNEVDYQISYSTNKKFKRGVKTIEVKAYTRKVKIKNLKKKAKILY